MAATIAIDQHDYLVATEMVRKEYGDAAVIGEPYLDSKGRIFADITTNDKFVDTVYLGASVKRDLDNLIGKQLRPQSNAAYDDLCDVLSKRARDEATKPVAKTTPPKQTVVAGK